MYFLVCKSSQLERSVLIQTFQTPFIPSITAFFIHSTKIQLKSSKLHPFYKKIQSISQSYHPKTFLSILKSSLSSQLPIQITAANFLMATLAKKKECMKMRRYNFPYL
jgi:hypothetical protein